MREFCSTCGTATDLTRQFCAGCGVFLGWKHWAPPLDARICPRCEAPNAPESTTCGHCFGNLRTGAAAGTSDTCGQVYLAQRGAELAGAGDVPLGPVVLACDHANPPGTVFCGTCGRYLEWDAATP